MHLFDANGVIKKYDTPEQIVEDFFHLRLDFYEKRKTALLRELGKVSLQLENKVRFIREVVDGTLVVSNRKKVDLCAELKKKGYTPLPKEAVVEASVAGAVDRIEGSEENEEEADEVVVEEEKPQVTASKTIPGTEYDYLLSMAIGSLTYEKMKQLWEERDAKKAEFDELTKTPSKSLWLQDLDALDNQLDEQDKRDAKDEAERRKQQEKARAKGPGGGRNARKPTRKPAVKKATITEIVEPMETSASTSMETDTVPAAKKAPKKAAAAPKKAPAKSKAKAPTLVDEDDDDEIPSLAARMGMSKLSEQDIKWVLGAACGIRSKRHVLARVNGRLFEGCLEALWRLLERLFGGWMERLLERLFGGWRLLEKLFEGCLEAFWRLLERLGWLPIQMGGCFVPAIHISLVLEIELMVAPWK